MRPGQKQFWFGLIVVKYTRFENKRNEAMRFLVSNLSNQGVKKEAVQGLRSSQNRSLLGVNEDFENKRNEVMRFLASTVNYNE